MATNSGTDRKVARISRVITWLSWERILAETKRPNGGEIVFLRSLLIALSVFSIYLLTIFAKHLADPNRTFSPNLHELLTELEKGIPIFGAIFAAVYFALYARFASQWIYLSNLYNKIVETEARTTDDARTVKILAGWKADFLEDALDLHLATKRVFAPIVLQWANVEAVKDHFVDRTTRTPQVFGTLVADVRAVCEMEWRRNGGVGEPPKPRPTPNRSFKRTRLRRAA